MTLQSSIKEIMTSNVIFVHYNDKVQKVESLMKRKHIRHVPVLKEGDLVGIVSLTDLQRLSFTANLATADVEDEVPIYELMSLDQVMVRDPKTVNVNETVKQVATVLCDHEFHALPVMENGLLVGIVTTTDLMKYLVDNCGN